MFDRSDLTAAKDAGLLTDEQQAQLDAFLTQRTDPAAAGRSENLRFLSNFNDVFISIGIVILAIGLTAVTAVIATPFLGSMVTGGTLAFAGALILMPVAAIMWLLAEYFCKRRRLVLPSMVLITIFVLYAGLSIGIIASGISGLNPETVESFTDAWGTLGNAGLATFVGGLIAGCLAFWRFRLPFTLLLIALSAAAATHTFFAFFGNIGNVIGGVSFFIIGLLTLAAAIFFDAKDPKRVTRNADHAFWLHVAAAPQLIWGLRSLITGSGLVMPSMLEAIFIVVILVLISIVSLALDRRALIVSGLLTFAMALGRIVEATGGGQRDTLIITTLLLGTGIILLGGGWRTARRFVLRILPSTPITRRIFPPEAS